MRSRSIWPGITSAVSIQLCVLLPRWKQDWQITAGRLLNCLGRHRIAADMTKIAPYHTNSIEEPPRHREVYHDHNDCPDGKRIMSKHLEQGTGGKPRCKECIKPASYFVPKCDFPTWSSRFVCVQDVPHSPKGHNGQPVN